MPTPRNSSSSTGRPAPTSAQPEASEHRARILQLELAHLTSIPTTTINEARDFVQGKKAPFYIRLRFTQRDRERHEAHADRRVELESIKQCMEILGAYARRWYTLDMTFQADAAWQSYIEEALPFVQQSLPNLEEFKLAVRGKYYQHADTWGPRYSVFAGGVPRMKFFFLEGLYIKWERNTFKNLRHLQYDGRWHRAGTAELVSVLAACPRLETLLLNFSGMHDTQENLSPIESRYLTTLSLRFESGRAACEFIAFWEAVHFPALSNFSLRGPELEPRDSLALINSIIRHRSGETLQGVTTFSLSFFIDLGPTLHELLWKMPFLRNLRFHHGVNPVTWIRELAEESRASYGFLRRLAITGEHMRIDTIVGFMNQRKNFGFPLRRMDVPVSWMPFVGSLHCFDGVETPGRKEGEGWWALETGVVGCTFKDWS